MSSLADLYSELKTDVVALADPLFDHSQTGLRARDFFLPHSAVLSAEGKVSMLGAMTGSKGGFANAPQVLRMVHKGLRQMSREKVLMAAAVASQVTLTRGDAPMTAIRVLVEHERGLTVALFLPFHRADEGRYFFGEAFVMPAEAELNLWMPPP
jgi:hypothetical protein